MEVRETADLAGRTSAAGRSLGKWFERESDTINRAIALGRERLCASPGDEETSRSVRDLERERQRLYKGWKSSTLRRTIESRAGETSLSPGGHERRAALPAAGFEIHAAGTSATTTAKSLSGYAIVYNKTSENLGGFVERIEPGACTEALRTSDVRCLFNHDSNYLLGRSSAATLELKEDNAGVHFRAYLLPFDPISYAIARRVDRRDVGGCSFSFVDPTDRWILEPGKIDMRIVERIGRIFDVGPVTYPAYPDTQGDCAKMGNLV